MHEELVQQHAQQGLTPADAAAVATAALGAEGAASSAASNEATTDDGEEMRAKVPDAKRFATVFCSVCGSLMPRVAPDMSIAVIPAGTLDNDPGLRPEARIFEGSKAPWSCDDAAVPGYDAYPG